MAGAIGHPRPGAVATRGLAGYRDPLRPLPERPVLSGTLAAATGAGPAWHRADRDRQWSLPGAEPPDGARWSPGQVLERDDRALTIAPLGAIRASCSRWHSTLGAATRAAPCAIACRCHRGSACRSDRRAGRCRRCARGARGRRRTGSSSSRRRGRRPPGRSRPSPLSCGAFGCRGRSPFQK